MSSGLAKKLKSNFTTEEYKKILSAYYGQISMLDHHIGSLFTYLKSNDLWNNTMIIFVSDHGDYAGAYGLFFKGQMYDACCKIPMFIKPAFYDGKGLVRSEVTNSLDLYGTILDTACDDEWKKDNIESRSLVPLFNPDFSKWDNETYSIIGDDKEHNLSMLRKDNLKIMRLACGRDKVIYEMYDMNDEVIEVRNVFDNMTYREQRNKLKAQLDLWWREQIEKYPTKIISHHRSN